VADHPNGGTLLLECFLLPPYAAAIQSAVVWPVFNVTRTARINVARAAVLRWLEDATPGR